MSEIAIVTFHTACNYGAFLQAYALQEALNDIEGVNAYMLDYQAPSIGSVYEPTAVLKSSGNPLKKLVQFVLCYGDIKKRNRLFAEYRKKHFRIKEQGLERSMLPTVCKNYNAFVTGSDQVWNRKHIKDDNTFLLDFVQPPAMKYSYAASLGEGNVPDAVIEDLLKHIKDYMRIAIREVAAAQQFAGYMEQGKVVCTLDPVFLLGQAWWRKFSKYKERKPYVLFFQMGMGKNMEPAMGFAKNLAANKGLDIVYLSDKERWFKYRDLNHFGVSDPAEFLGLIDNAKYVVTNSFHGTAFSIILQTPFYVETSIASNGRILNILEKLALNQCALVEGKPTVQGLDIDWRAVEGLLQPEIEFSKQYLLGIAADLHTEAEGGQ